MNKRQPFCFELCHLTLESILCLRFECLSFKCMRCVCYYGLGDRHNTHASVAHDFVEALYTWYTIIHYIFKFLKLKLENDKRIMLDEPQFDDWIEGINVKLKRIWKGFLPMQHQHSSIALNNFQRIEIKENEIEYQRLPYSSISKCTNKWK